MSSPVPPSSPPSPSTSRSPLGSSIVQRPVLHPARHRALQWIRWFGIARLVVVAVSALLLVVGALWVVHVPPPSTASSIPDEEPAIPVVTLVGAPATTAPDRLTVHVSGAVVEPGVHEVEAGSRVIGAIVTAGGALPEAELDAINLAAPLADGQRVHVPLVGEPVDPFPLLDPSGLGDGPPPPVDVNRASATELEQLPGVGPTIAHAIVDERDRGGPFTSVDQLVRVRGIGPAKLEAIAPLVTL